MTNSTAAPLSAEQLDKLEAHARSKAGANSVWLSASETLALIAQARSAAPAGQADELANVLLPFAAPAGQHDAGTAEKVACAECKGTGGVRIAGDCSDCNGKGYDWEPAE